jgi:hypothetical protein
MTFVSKSLKVIEKCDVYIKQSSSCRSNGAPALERYRFLRMPTEIAVENTAPEGNA